MNKEPKKSASLTNNTCENDSQLHCQANSEFQNSASGNGSAQSLSVFKPLLHLGEEFKATVFDTQGYIKINYFTLFWLFVSGSVVGLGLETLYHFVVFGGFQSRAGLLWGPFSPIYGVGAVFLTIFLNRYYHSHNLVIFLISMVVGSFTEYAASWFMEVFWGAIAWDYTGTFGSIQGRTNFFFGMMWGMLGLVWVRIMMPFMRRIFTRINQMSKIVSSVTLLLSIFMAANIAFTCLVLARQNERSIGMEASNPIQTFCDEHYPDEYLAERFENMGRK